MQESKQEVTKVVSLVKTGGKSTKCIKFPLASGLEIQNVPFTTSSRPRLESSCLRTCAKRTGCIPQFRTFEPGAKMSITRGRARNQSENTFCCTF